MLSTYASFKVSEPTVPDPSYVVDYRYTHAFWMPQHSWGGVLEYSKYVAQHLKPWIDRNYRTLSDRDNTHVVGSSHGGLAAFHVAMVNPNVFGSAFCLSPSCVYLMLLICDPIPRISYQTLSTPSDVDSGLAMMPSCSMSPLRIVPYSTCIISF